MRQSLSGAPVPLPRPQVCAAFRGCFASLCMNKFSSNVMEKSLQSAPDDRGLSSPPPLSSPPLTTRGQPHSRSFFATRHPSLGWVAFATRGPGGDIQESFVAELMEPATLLAAPRQAGGGMGGIPCKFLPQPNWMWRIGDTIIQRCLGKFK